MAFESMGLGALLKFDTGRAVVAMKKASGAFGRLKVAAVRASSAAGRAAKTLRQAGRGIGKIAQGASNAALAMTPLAIAVGFAGKQAVDFEQGVANLGAVLLKTPGQMGPLIKKAKELGATTKFSASESILAMENLARAGFKEGQVIKAIGGVMDAAAADGLDLAASANIVAGAIRGMGLETDQAAGVANTLAFVSSKTRTNIAALGENLRYTMAQAKTMNVDFAQLSAALGVTSDSLGSTTVAGTSLTQMLAKLSKPTSAGTGLLKKFGFQAKYTAAGQLDLAASLGPVKAGIDAITDPLERAKTQTELFGLRGQKAFSALSGALPKLNELTGLARDQFGKLSGAAGKMAAIRMDTTMGGLTLLKSALEGLSIEVMGPLLGNFAGFIKTATKGIGDVVKGIMALSSKGGEASTEFQKLSPTMQSVAKGVKGAIEGIQESLRDLGTWLKNTAKWFKQAVPGMTIEKLTRIATKFVILTPLIVAAGIAVKGLSFALSGVLSPALKGTQMAVKSLYSAFGPIGIAVAGLVAVFTYFHDDVSRAMGGIAYAEGNVGQALDSTEKKLLRNRDRMRDLETTIAESSRNIGKSVKGEINTSLEGVSETLESVTGPAFKVFGKTAEETMRGLAEVINGPVIDALKNSAIVIEKVVMPSMENLTQRTREMLSEVKKLIEETTDPGGVVKVKPGELPEIRVALPELKAPKPVFGWAALGVSVEKGAAKGAERGSARGSARGSEAGTRRGMTLEECIETLVEIDGREVARAYARVHREQLERSSASFTPWTYRTLVEQGAVPV